MFGFVFEFLWYLMLIRNYLVNIRFLRLSWVSVGSVFRFIDRLYNLSKYWKLFRSLCVVL